MASYGIQLVIKYTAAGVSGHLPVMQGSRRAGARAVRAVPEGTPVAGACLPAVRHASAAGSWRNCLSELPEKSFDAQ